MAVADPLLLKLRELRKRRGPYRSLTTAQRELVRLRALLPEDSIEREVFELAQVRGLSYKFIAAQLSISLRQVYRVRRRMMEFLEAGQTPTLACEHDVPQSTLELAWTLLKYGDAGAAAATASRLHLGELAPRDRMERHLLHATISCNLGRFDAAQAALSHARETVAELPGDERAFALRRTAVVAAYIPYYQGYYGRAIEQCEQATRSFLYSDVPPREARWLARDLIFLGIMHQEHRSPYQAIGILTRAERVLRNAAHSSLAEASTILANRALAHLSVPDGLPLAKRDASEALVIAQSNGLCYEHVWAKLVLGALFEIQNQPRIAMAHTNDALDLGRVVLSGDPLIRTHFVATRAQLKVGQAREALERFIEIKPLIQGDSLLGIFQHLVQARIYRKIGDVRSATEHATAAIAGFEKKSAFTHHLGWGYLIRATGKQRMGVKSVDDAEAAISYLRLGAYIPDQDYAVRVATNIRARSR